MGAGGIFFVLARPLAEAFPERWWVPSAEMLEAITPRRALVRALALESGGDGGANLADAATIWLAVEERNEQSVTGTIRSSPLRQLGYCEGDAITIALDRLVDVVELEADGRPKLNEERARFAIGKRVLVGLTVLDQGGEIVGQRQFLGTVASVDPVEGIELVREGKSSYWLPPDGRCLEEAPPGEYRLRSTGEVVVDPDYLTTWTVTRDSALDAADTGYR